MGKSASKIFARGFLKSFLLVALFAVVSVLSYKLFIHSYGIEGNDIIEIIPPVHKQKIITEAIIDGVSKHLIYSIDEETGDIDKLLLEIFNCEEQSLYYITIPIKTQLNLSDSLHKELVLEMPSMPQFLKLSAITGYFPKELAYEYGVLMIEDLLDIQISYYSVVPQNIYETVFVTETTDQQGPEQSLPREIFSDQFLDYLQTIETETQLRDYIKKLYDEIISNLPYKDKLNYMESYLNITRENIIFEMISGVDSNSAFTINEQMVAKQLKAYIGE